MQTPDTHDTVVHALGGATMGTTWSVRCVGTRGLDLRALYAGIQRQLDGIVSEMSNWTPESHLSRFNSAAAGTWHTLPDDFWTVLECALQIARDSDGRFDPTVGPAVDAWGFGPADAADVPDPQQLATLCARIGWRRIEVRGDERRVLQPGGLQLDLCAIAKGFAVDRVAAYLRQQGVGAALVEVGGELFGYGHKPDGQPWRIVVEGWSGDATDDREARVIALDGHGVATSGDRWHGREHDGHRHCHTLDPHSGRALHDAPTAVTVIAADTMRADAWATALTVMGDEAGYAYACGQGLAVRFIGPRATGCVERMTPAFEALLER